jgi:hypothetical protein
LLQSSNMATTPSCRLGAYLSQAAPGAAATADPRMVVISHVTPKTSCCSPQQRVSYTRTGSRITRCQSRELHVRRYWKLIRKPLSQYIRFAKKGRPIGACIGDIHVLLVQKPGEVIGRPQRIFQCGPLDRVRAFFVPRSVDFSLTLVRFSVVTDSLSSACRLVDSPISVATLVCFDSSAALLT